MARLKMRKSMNSSIKVQVCQLMYSAINLVIKRWIHWSEPIEHYNLFFSKKGLAIKMFLKCIQSKNVLALEM